MIWVPKSIFTKPRNRPQAAFSDNLREEDVANPKRLLDLLRKAVNRISNLEKKSQEEATEFEVQVTTSMGTVTLNHGYSGPIRFYQTWWQSAGAEANPQFSYNTASVPGKLVLDVANGTVGTAVIRVEPAKFAPTVN